MGESAGESKTRIVTSFQRKKAAAMQENPVARAADAFFSKILAPIPRVGQRIENLVARGRADDERRRVGRPKLHQTFRCDLSSPGSFHRHFILLESRPENRHVASTFELAN